MRTLQRLLLLIGIVCLGMYVVFTVQAHLYQDWMDQEFEYMVREPASRTVERRALSEGDLVGRLEIPRLDLSVIVLEGVKARTLRLGAGHIPGTAMPGDGGNIGIAAHRDTFFRALAKISPEDRIRFQTPEKTVEYRVTSTAIVEPTATEVLEPNGKDTLTLVTCYPFSYIGPAPKRFIVTATAAE
jgi:LPXTG-site transpeptidase (sortase) family protein